MSVGPPADIAARAAALGGSGGMRYVPSHIDVPEEVKPDPLMQVKANVDPLSVIPTEQVLVVEHEGRQIGAVVVERVLGPGQTERVLFSQEPCPTCKQDWARALEGDVKIIWPEHYKTVDTAPDK